MKKSKRFTYQGINNLSYIISVLFIIQLLLRNIRKYGLLLLIPLENLSLFELFISSAVHLLNVLKCLLVYLLARNKKSSFFILLFIESSIGLLIFKNISHLYFSFINVSLSLYLFTKVISFIVEINYKEKNIKNYFLFLLFPTMIYKKRFERKKYINYKNIYKKLIVLVFCSLMLNFIADQLAIPTLERLINNLKLHLFMEYFLILSIVTIIMFMLLFVIVFNSLLPIIAELTWYKNRNYYSDWWNKNTVTEFWASWNKEMHFWFKSYIYKPMLVKGYSKRFACFMCFFVSGILHEYAISISSKYLQFYTFLGFMSQLVLMETTDRISLYFPKVGNYLFWMMFCVIGQPICIWLIYKSNYNKMTGNIELLNYLKNKK
ncbi:hypothetical protein H312_00374 [Anncaliia algerae PRA339]|uniref:diacylglycerol O-acyltransferase n=1 Tax=Anncaliia algerae PRA339 TaxID=1288291 RepID=A0A059F4K2_9MICR|nr:hypothetical protein H312_00374 [Anncaliia algerae PRA339]